MPLTLADIERLRSTPGASLLLFLTDRCPVGCGHCSVSSLPDSPTIRDWSVFAEVLAGIAALPDLRAVAISGGEPFTERRGLIVSVETLRAAGLQIVLFTSGNWAVQRRIASWIPDVLRQVSTVYLSTDAFHVEAIDTTQLARAAQTIADAGCHLIVQVLETHQQQTFWPPGAEVSVIAPLRLGRGRAQFDPPPRRRIQDFGRCRLTASPTVRYDGTVLGCCNEAVIAGVGPRALRRTLTDAASRDLGATLAALRDEPLLRILERSGPRLLPDIPGFAELADTSHSTICEACWAAHAVMERNPASRLAAGLVA